MSPFDLYLMLLKKYEVSPLLASYSGDVDLSTNAQSGPQELATIFLGAAGYIDLSVTLTESSGARGAYAGVALFSGSTQLKVLSYSVSEVPSVGATKTWRSDLLSAGTYILRSYCYHGTGTGTFEVHWTAAGAY